MQTSTTAQTGAFANAPAQARFSRPRRQMRFVAIWIALVMLVAVCAVLLPRSVHPATIQTILPFVAFLALAAMGQAIVLMARGIDLSVPGTVGLASAVLIGVSGGSDDRLWLAIIVTLLVSAGIGAVNGLLVAVLKLNALIVTLSAGAIVSGFTLWYRQGFGAEAKVPETLADFGSSRFLSLPVAVWFAALMALLLTVALKKTIAGRRFELVGANPRAAFATGIEIMRYQVGAFTLAGFLYGVLAILLSGFIRNPTLEVGAPYLLAPIAAAVLGGTAIAGGIGSMIAVCGASIFLIQLGQALKMIGLPTSWQMVIQGCAIVVGMWMSEYAANRNRRKSH